MRKSSKFKVQSSKFSQNGQMLIILLLVMIVGLTIGLFLMSRTTTDVSVTTKFTDSTRAFNAAEAGIEEAIRDIGSITAGSPVPLASGVNYTVNPEDLGSGSIYPDPTPQPLNPGETLTLWLVNHNADGSINETSVYTNNNMDICFTDNALGDPAVSVTVHFKEASTYKTAYYGYDPDPGSRPVPNNFEQAASVGQCISQNNYDFQGNLHFNNDLGVNPTSVVLLAIRIRALYYATSIAIRPYGTFPSQGKLIESIGTAGDTTRRIQVIQPYAEPPAFFDYAIFSKTGNLVK